MRSPLDYCAQCGRLIVDTDDNGCEDANGQRWCRDHFAAACAEVWGYEPDDKLLFTVLDSEYLAKLLRSHVERKVRA